MTLPSGGDGKCESSCQTDADCPASPTGEHDIFTLSLTIDRLSGDAASWRRVNQGFMNTLRKQFLIWRTISPPARRGYEERANELLAGVEQAKAA